MKNLIATALFCAAAWGQADKQPTAQSKADGAPTEAAPKRIVKPFVPPKEINWEIASKPLERAVTNANYVYMREGMTYPQAAELLGAEGQELSSSFLGGVRTVVYQWTARSGVGNMNAMFQNGKLVSKAQFGLK